MFIERIPDADKRAYMQKIIDGEANIRKDNILRPVECQDWEAEMIRRRGYNQKIANLKKRNIYFEISQSSRPFFNGNDYYRRRQAVIVAFGDTTVKKIQSLLSGFDSLPKNLEYIFDQIKFLEGELKSADSLEVDNTYVKEFMLPNLQAIDEKQKTHLVADYKEALNDQFAKKKYLAIPNIDNIQKQQDELGLEK